MNRIWGADKLLHTKQKVIIQDIASLGALFNFSSLCHTEWKPQQKANKCISQSQPYPGERPYPTDWRSDKNLALYICMPLFVLGAQWQFCPGGGGCGGNNTKYPDLSLLCWGIEHWDGILNFVIIKIFHFLWALVQKFWHIKLQQQ